MNLNHLYFDVFKIGLMAVLSFFAIGLALSIPLCLLWNWLMPKIFDLPTLNLIEAFGLSALITFLSPRQIDFTNKKVKQQQDLDEQINKIFEDFKTNF
tara:strand:- start:546 stop:839 length:294 start_codon:yes stop_codon:yes gene_type:complete